MKILAITLVLMLGAIPVFAHTETIPHEHELNGKNSDNWVVGAKVDMPNIVKLSDSWNFGAEYSKDLHNTNMSEGHSVFAKLTWTGNFIDLSQ